MLFGVILGSWEIDWTALFARGFTGARRFAPDVASGCRAAATSRVNTSVSSLSPSIDALSRAFAARAVPCARIDADLKANHLWRPLQACKMQ